MTRTREPTAPLARVVAVTLTDGSVVWNIELYDDDNAVAATIGVIGSHAVAQQLADVINCNAPWIDY